MARPRDDVFRGSDALRRGLLTRAQLRGSRWRRLRHDVCCDTRLEPLHQLMARAVALVAPPEAVFAGLTAASWWSMRGPLAGPDDPVELVLPPAVRWNPGRGAVVRQAVTSGDVVTDGRLRCTDRTRTALDLIRRGPAPGPPLPRAASSSLTAERPPSRCTVREDARRSGDLIVARGRLLIHRSPVPVPVAQLEIRHEGRFVARVDLAFPEQELAVEYDGAWHGGPSQLSKDRARMNRLLAAGWRVLFVTAADMRNPAALLDRIAAALAA